MLLRKKGFNKSQTPPCYKKDTEMSAALCYRVQNDSGDRLKSCCLSSLWYKVYQLISSQRNLLLHVYISSTSTDWKPSGNFKWFLQRPVRNEKWFNFTLNYAGESWASFHQLWLSPCFMILNHDKQQQKQHQTFLVLSLLSLLCLSQTAACCLMHPKFKL